MKTFFRPLALKGIRSYFAFRFFWPVWYYVLNREGRRLYGQSGKTLDAVQERISRDLRRDGIAVAHVDELFPCRDLLNRLREYTERERVNAETRTHKTFLKNLWDGVPTIDLANPFVRFAVDNKILGCINAYMGMFTKFYYFTLNVTMPVPEGSEAVQSQRWHRDPEDKKLCKIFLYLSDVDETAGPFTYIRGTQHGGKWRALAPQEPPRGSYPPADKIERIIPREDMLVGTGRAGTIIFCDTSGIHKGGYATKKERLMFTAGYCSKATAWPIRYHRTQEFETALQEMASTDAVGYAFRSYRAPLAAYFFRTIKKDFHYEG